MLLGMLILVRLEQYLKAPVPILTTLSGIVMLTRLLQLEKAEEPIYATLSGTVTLVMVLCPANTPSEIPFTPARTETVDPLPTYA